MSEETQKAEVCWKSVKQGVTYSRDKEHWSVRCVQMGNDRLCDSVRVAHCWRDIFSREVFSV